MADKDEPYDPTAIMHRRLANGEAAESLRRHLEEEAKIPATYKPGEGFTLPPGYYDDDWMDKLTFPKLPKP